MAKQRRPRRTDPELERTWRERMAAWAASGLNGREFCRAHGLGEASFYAWRRKLRERDAAAAPAKRPRSRTARSKAKAEAPRRSSKATPPPAFVPVTVVGSPEPAPIEIVHGGGATVRVQATVDVELLTSVLVALDRASSC